jgi:AcrR family transcriptional regulator
MGRVTNFSKEYLLFKSMVYAEENGLNSITARKLAAYCGCSTYPIYAHFESIGVLKEKITEEIVYSFDRFLLEYEVSDFHSIVQLLKEFFLVHESIRGIVNKSKLDLAALFKKSFTEHLRSGTGITEQYLIELLWLNALGCLNSDGSSLEFYETITAIWNKLAELDDGLPEVLTNITLGEKQLS